MHIVVASDEKNHLTDFVLKYLKDQGHRLILMGDLVKKDSRWVEIGKEAALKIASGEVDEGVLLCWSGTGISMAANRFKGVRAALCWDAKIAAAARKWDNANVLCLAYGFLSKKKVKEILEAWFTTKFDEEGLNEAHKLDE